ncbi:MULTISPECIES: UPF0228 family protein [Methanosarcina]|jgi:hypothetical protein|uniref:UPF0228 protein MM_1428 n=8 Tax=Methanosarcina mazei TaxID=2209 RepID=Y1428_METMA|nr:MULTISPECIES: UPF0228 family protein [Methanosarcina]Q8PWZ4.1 RecName: Full=UPF0228 protein MM_1428 [Methanosarcina mazei Go1]AAM31124.1 conserved protein [Methanosarcina mazei Go1]AGF96856.1 hypothetical protein MmTuc01_1487 [Methanosarcina mazei Tuc01]AKB42174.1 hypothetical protein MSMAW_3183 [Methanosarcina mazei WWM610]AKB63086.1 hypothetical protein MSMAP_3101 [Methanosarcina mazei SarPi]AKB66430.1 hypothetical protein MSMAS_3234 [Methanosarcina mazei S-6]
MSKINGKIAVFTVFLVLVVVYGYMQAPTNREVKIDSFLIQFENGTTEPEVKAILENYNMTLNYSIDCNSDNGGYKYYIKVDKDDMPDVVKDGLKKDKNWTDSGSPSFTKGDYVIYPVTEQAIHDKNFLEILKRHNIQVKTFVWCLVSYRDNSTRYDVLGKNCITEKDANRITNELEMNENVLIVMPEYICY